VTGSAIAIPLLGATGASAASGTTWDAVAECESGGSWSADSGNGRYGGLQMTQEAWEEHGGLDYAMSPDHASRSQQIAVAERVLAAQGTNAWATCGLIAGLTQDSDSADVDTGLAQDSASPSTGSGSTSGDNADNETKSDELGESGKSDSPTGEADSQSPDSSSTGDSTGTTDATDSANGGNSDKSAQNGDASTDADSDFDSDSGIDSGSGRHRGGSADEDAAASRTDDTSGRHASRGDSASREAADAADGSYTVRAGDSLWGIADSLDLKGGWRELYAANEEALGADPDLIRPGQTLELGSE
jgi:LysM repeat protein